MGFENLSNGESDGFVLFYLKDGKLNTVLLTKDQAEMIDFSLKIGFGKSEAKVVPSEKDEILKYLED